MLQANKLAEYKPIINVKYLPENFERVMEITDDAHRFFNHTRLLVLYYEDLVTESHVSLTTLHPFSPILTVMFVPVIWIIQMLNLNFPT